MLRAGVPLVIVRAMGSCCGEADNISGRVIANEIRERISPVFVPELNRGGINNY